MNSLDWMLLFSQDSPNDKHTQFYPLYKYILKYSFDTQTCCICSNITAEPEKILLYRKKGRMILKLKLFVLGVGFWQSNVLVEFHHLGSKNLWNLRVRNIIEFSSFTNDEKHRRGGGVKVTIYHFSKNQNIIYLGGEVANIYYHLHWVVLSSSVWSCFDSDDVKLISEHWNISTYVLQYM